MYSTVRFVVIITLIGATLQVVFGIKCWECRSDLDPKCADPFDNKSLPLSDCSRKSLVHLPNVRSTLCRKVRQKVNGEWRYIRSCAYIGEPGIGGDERYCLMRSGTYNIFVEYCTCNSKDGCNSGPEVVPLMHLSAVFIVGQYLLHYVMPNILQDVG